MLKKFWLAALVLFVMSGSALAAVDVNSADQAGLDSIAGIGPATSKAILAEREKNGNFKDWADLERRVKGVGSRNAVKLSAAGLTVNGKSYEGAAGTGKASKSAEKSADKAAEKGGDKSMDKASDKGGDKPAAAKQ
ncbi:MAG: ComEA family DNA-binding protein [Burkholderiaceae bacterium]